jgi:hypothetical protein
MFWPFIKLGPRVGGAPSQSGFDTLPPGSTLRKGFFRFRGLF